MIKSIMVAIAFLTRIPIRINFDFGEVDLARTSPFFPLVGGLIGLLVAAMASFFSLLNSGVGAVTGILAGIILTGGLHLDGAMDTADGIFSARTREKILEIMKDSRVGAHGVTAAIILLLLKFVLYQSVIENNEVFWVIPMAFLISRWAMVFVILSFPSARQEGLGQIFVKYKRRFDLPVATFLTLVPICIWGQWLTLVPMAVTVLLVWLCCCTVNKILGGLTGDIYGAMAELSEVLFILFFTVFYHSQTVLSIFG